MSSIKEKLAALIKKVAMIINSRPMTTLESIVYQKAAQSLGRHMTLNEAIPAEVGCAEAVSAVLSLAGVSDGTKGIAGTSALEDWVIQSGRFTKIPIPETGALLISATGKGNGSVEGHTGFFGRYDLRFPADWGLLSNDSASGLFLERWSWSRWQKHYSGAGGLPCNIYRLN